MDLDLAGRTVIVTGAARGIGRAIAEGFGRESRPDLVKFLRIARGSLNELMTQHELACNARMLKSQTTTVELMAETGRVLQALIYSLKNK